MFGLNDNQDEDQTKSDSPADSPDDSLNQTAPASQPEPPAHDELANLPAPKSTQADDEQLINLKERALKDLSPLVSHLDQTPEEKFRTLMMMIQAADNASLVQDAYAAAKQIDDEKSRAQALLDIVNEINYFTQKDDKPKD